MIASRLTILSCVLGKEVSLDLSPGKISPGAFRRLLHRIHEEAGKNDASTGYTGIHDLIADLEFESTLRLVDIPALSDTTETKELTHNELGIPDYARDIFRWLRKKGVRDIVEVRVADSYSKPHSEELIIDALKEFDVEILDWRRTDLSVDAILEAAANVKTLYLYSSGNWSALGHWISPDGVQKLPKVTIFQTHVETTDQFFI